MFGLEFNPMSMSDVDWTRAGAFATVVMMVLGVIAATQVHPIKTFVDKAIKALDSVNPVSAINRRFDTLEQEFRPNGGGSLRDLLDKIWDHVQEESAKVSILLDNSPLLMWLSAADGRQIWANDSLVALTGHKASDLLDWGWLNLIHYRDRDRVRRHWLEAIEDARAFDECCRIVTANRDVYEVRLLAKPFRIGGHVAFWRGLATARLEELGQSPGPKPIAPPGHA